MLNQTTLFERNHDGITFLCQCNLCKNTKFEILNYRFLLKIVNWKLDDTYPKTWRAICKVRCMAIQIRLVSKLQLKKCFYIPSSKEFLRKIYVVCRYLYETHTCEESRNDVTRDSWGNLKPNNRSWCWI